MANETILVVEDTELLRRMYVDRLGAEGYTVLEAGDGQQALDTIATNDVDLVLLDLIMPRMSGLEALERMKADPKTASIPVLILSNMGQGDDVRRGMSLGAVDYLIKNSAKPTEVSAMIRETLDKRSTGETQTHSYALLIDDRGGDVDKFIFDAGFPHRLWCPRCEVRLVMRVVPKDGEHGHYDAVVECPSCGRTP